MSLKVFNLRCAQSHAFEGWFASAEDFDAQRDGGLLCCPLCGNADVQKMPAAPYLGGNASEPAVKAETAPAAAQPALRPTAAQMQAGALKMAREIAARTEDVGERFAEEARRIHYREAPERGIRGVASRDEAQALQDEGIAVMPLPFGALLKDPLQ